MQNSELAGSPLVLALDPGKLSQWKGSKRRTFLVVVSAIDPSRRRRRRSLAL